MYLIAGIMTLSVFGLIALGVYLELTPDRKIASPKRARG